MHNYRSTHEYIITHFNMTTYRNIIGKYRVITNSTIMSDMTVIHKITTRTNKGFTINFSSSVCSKAFSENIIITNLQPRNSFGFKSSILG